MKRLGILMLMGVVMSMSASAFAQNEELPYLPESAVTISLTNKSKDARFLYVCKRKAEWGITATLKIEENRFQTGDLRTGIYYEEPQASTVTKIVWSDSWDSDSVFDHDALGGTKEISTLGFRNKKEYKDSGFKASFEFAQDDMPEGWYMPLVGSGKRRMHACCYLCRG